MFKNKLDLFVEYFLFLAVCTFCLQLSLNLNEKFNILKPEEEVKNLEARSANGGGVLNKDIEPGENVVMNAGNIISYESKYYPSDEVLLDYENKILGISFSYPESWGEVRTKPEVLTSVDLFFEEYRSKNNDNFNEQGIKLMFDNSDVVFTFVNMEARVRDYFDRFIDSIDYLEGVENVCDLKIDWDIHPLYRKCENDVLQMFVRQNSGHSKFDYNFMSRNFALKKTKADHFNKLLISSQVSVYKNIYGTSTEEMSIEEYLGHIGVSKEEYDRQMSRFMDLVASIEIFEPKEIEIEMNKISENDTGEIKLIKTYLNALLESDLERAYDLLANTDSDKEKFFEENSNIIRANILDTDNLSLGNYVANIAFQKDNEWKAKYKYFFNSQNGKLDIYKKEQIVAELRQGNLRANVKRVDDKNYVMLNTGTEDITVDEAYNDYDNRRLNEVYHYGELEFSPNGNYLVYSLYGWEWGGKKVYDINAQKFVSGDVYSSADILKIANNEKYFFACAESDMGGEYYVKVFSLPGGQEVFDAIGDTGLYHNDCEYDEATGILNIKIKTPFVTENFDEVSYKIDLANAKVLERVGPDLEL